MKIAAAIVVSVAALAFGGAAYAAYPGTYGIQDGRALGEIHVSSSAGDTAVQTASQRALISGAYGIPTLMPANVPLGMFRDGSRFVLQSLGMESSTSFAVVRTADLGVEQTIALAGSFAFDALSTDGRTLYLVQHTSADFQHYVLRAYDLVAKRLLPGRIADRTQKSWVMQGWPVTRVTTPNGRWVYTLYANPGGFPFVHALDTVKRVAHCVGFAWSGNQNALDGFRLEVSGSHLLVLRASGVVYRSIDRTTWAVSLR